MSRIKEMPNPAIAERLRVLMSGHKTLSTQQAVAEKAGIAQRTIGRILNSEASSSLSTYESICRAFGVPLDYLTTTKNDKIQQKFLTSHAVALVTKQELIDWTFGGKMLENICPISDREFLMTDIKTNEPSHFVQVEDDSMLEELPKNCFAHVDVSRNPKRGDLVEAKLKDNSIVIRKYKPLTSGGFELLSKNNIFDTVGSNDVEQIIGVVVEWRVKLY